MKKLLSAKTILKKLDKYPHGTVFSSTINTLDGDNPTDLFMVIGTRLSERTLIQVDGDLNDDMYIYSFTEYCAKLGSSEHANEQVIEDYKAECFCVNNKVKVAGVKIVKCKKKKK